MTVEGAPDPFTDQAEAELVARGVASAIAADGHLEPVQCSLLGAVLGAVHGATVDLDDLAPLDPAALAAGLAHRDEDFRHRIVHHMVLGELILRPIPPAVARRVADYAEALGVEDRFVRVARRYAQGAFGLAWLDLHRSGFAEHWERVRTEGLRTDVRLPDQLSPGVEDPELARCWNAFESFPAGTLGRGVWDMYHGRGFAIPGSPGGASAYLAQHDFVHVLADYGTNLAGELEVFALIGRADPDPKGFAWLTTLVGLFETGYVADAGFFTGDLQERRLDGPEAHVRLADALRRGAIVRNRLGVDLLDVDYHEHATHPVEQVRDELGITPKSPDAIIAGSAGAFDVEGMSVIQQQYAAGAGTEP